MDTGTLWERYRGHTDAPQAENLSAVERERLRREARQIIDRAHRKRRPGLGRLAIFTFPGRGERSA